MSRPYLIPAVLLFSWLSSSSTWAFQAAVRLHSNVPSASKLFSLQQQTVDLSIYAPRNYDGFINWASYYGVSQENFQIAAQSGDWGVVAAQPAAAGSRVLYVPSMLRLTSSGVRETDFNNIDGFVKAYFDATNSQGDINLGCHFYLFLKVLQEFDLGDQSAYFPWLDALPRKFTTAIMFDDFEIDCLPPFVKMLALRDRSNYELFVEVLQQVPTPTISDRTKYSPDITKWAFNVVFTRARAAFGEAEIIPGPDMLNHESNPNVEVQYDNEGNVYVMALRDIYPGEPLHKCYSQPTNPSRFLATYGFFDTSPPATYCKLFAGQTLTPELANLGFKYDRMVFYVDNGAIAEEVWDVMLYTVLGNIDPSVQQQFYQAHMTGDANTKAQLHQYYMPQTCAGLLDHVNNMLVELGNCQAKMEGRGLQHEHLPMIRRHNEFVQQTFLKVKSNLEQMMYM